jgi:hypothetical protein
MPTRAALSLSLLLCACAGPNPLVGDWTCPTGSVDWTNEMSVAEDLAGEVLLHFEQGGVAYHATFDLTAQDRGGGLYWLDVACAEDCPPEGMDFRMTCEMAEDEQTLGCEADGWYELGWVRQG